jgi:hypothetical protein
MAKSAPAARRLLLSRACGSSAAYRLITAGAAALLTAICVAGSAGAQTVVTHHNTNGRTGWNARESVLTPATVAGGTFRQLRVVPLDEQVDAQPLFVAGQSISGKGVHDVVYVATANNTVYAIDANSGSVLLRRTLGMPVSASTVPGQCSNSSKVIGITGTPVISTASHTLFVLTYTSEGGVPVYRLHALALDTLNETANRYVSAQGSLTNGVVYHFNAAVSRQRTALLLSGGNIYAGFSSFCDNDPATTRGWVLGWKASTLQPLAKAQLEDRLATSPKNFFLAAVWMSGFGAAADSSGSIYFVTGNSDPTRTAPSAPDLSETALKYSADLSTLQSSFTPGAASDGFAAMEQVDNDFGAGGITLLPDQPGKFPRLAVAAGKVGKMYLLNRDAMGGFHNGSDNVLSAVTIGECYCGQSYYMGSDGVGRVVSSGGNKAIVWRVVTSASAKPSLVQESVSPAITSGQDAGFFTSISSNARAAHSQIIWAVSRPTTFNNGAAVMLYAFDPSNIQSGNSTLLFSGAAGTWPNGDGNANLVPVVAKGHVFVASYKQLAIFGLSGAKVKAGSGFAAEMATAPAASSGPALYGTVERIDGTHFTLTLRTGRAVPVNAVALKASGNGAALLVPGRTVLVRGRYVDGGVLYATAIQRAKSSPALWGPDR